MKGSTKLESKKQKAKDEMASLFRKKSNIAPKKCAWKHKFVCLAYHDQHRIPTTDTDKDDLLQAGKEIDLDLIIFPSLKEGGGYLSVLPILVCWSSYHPLLSHLPCWKCPYIYMSTSARS